MTLLERLQNHRGGLVRIESELYWYSTRCWDGSPGRICLVLDATAASAAEDYAAAAATAAATGAGVDSAATGAGVDSAATAAAGARVDAAAAAPTGYPTSRAASLLLIDGKPQWIWMAEADVEILDGGDQ